MSHARAAANLLRPASIAAMFLTASVRRSRPMPPAGPAVFGIPVDFILFALTLLGVALFHNHTLRVGLTGLAVITAYKLVFTGFKTGPGVQGLISHFGHEWVILTNLLCLLLGFALLSRHFEKTHIPAVLPRFLPHDWKGAFILLVMVFVLSSFLDNIAAALIGGAMAHTLFRAKVHVGYLAAIVAASNAGGSGSVVGDTTTTMMWISGVSPAAVFHAYAAAAVALVVCGIPAALQQHKYSPIIKHEHSHIRIDWPRAGIVALILIFAIVANVIVNVRFTEVSDSFPFIGAAVWIAILLSVPLRRPGLGTAARGDQRLDLPAVAGDLRLDDAGGSAAGRVLALRFRPGLRLGGVRQHPAHRAGAEAGRLRLGHARLHRGLRRLDDLVRLQRRGGAVQHVSGGEIGRQLGEARLACDARLCGRLRRADADAGLAADAGTRRPACGERARKPAPLRRLRFCRSSGCYRNEGRVRQPDFPRLTACAHR